MTYQKNIDKGRWWNFGWQLVSGCDRVSPACDNCWSLAMEHRYGISPEVKFHSERLAKPLKRKKPASYAVWNDLFHESVFFESITQVCDIMVGTPRHQFLLLTKRPKRAIKYCKWWFDKSGESPFSLNVSVGVTCENQKTADERIPILLQIPAAKRFLSLEPLLGDVDLENVTMQLPNSISTVKGTVLGSNGRYFTPGGAKGTGVDWVIIGCESGAKRRLTKIEWIEHIVEQCRAAGVKVFVKQMEIDGKVEHDITKFPEHLQIREII